MVAGRELDIRKTKKKINEVILKITQGKVQSRNDEGRIEFRAAVLNVCYCPGSFTDGKTLLSVTDFNAQNDSQGGTFSMILKVRISWIFQNLS